MWYQCFFIVQEHRGRSHFIVEIKGNVVRQPHTFQCRAVTFTETKLQCSLFSAFLDYIKDDFFE
jgi:hypothetical protein